MMSNAFTARPRVTIGMPVYNGEKFVETAIQSILSQTFEEFEFVICDNASTDDTEQICRHYAEADARIRYVRLPENVGASGNFNRVLELARAPYFRWACDDDVLMPANVERCVEVLDRAPEVVLAAPRTTVIDANGDTVPNQGWLRRLDLRSPRPSERFAEFLQAYRWLGCGSQLFGVTRTEVLRSTAGLGDFPSSDYVLLAEMTLRGQFAEVDEVLFQKRIHEDSSVEGTDWQIDKMAEWLNPDNRGKSQWLELKWLGELIRAVRQAPVTGRERVRCYRQLFGEYALPHSKKILKELLVLFVDGVTMGSHKPVRKFNGFNTMYKIY